MDSEAVPAGFPMSDALGAVPGAQPKLLARKEGARFVAAPGESEVRARYAMCEDLARQLAQYTARKSAEHADWSRDHLHSKVAEAVKAKAGGWGLSPAEVTWVLRRVATLTEEADGGPTS